MNTSLLPMMWEQVQEPILRRLRGNFPSNLLRMVETYNQWADAEWEQLKAILYKECASAYEEAVVGDINSQSLNSW